MSTGTRARSRRHERAGQLGSFQPLKDCAKSMAAPHCRSHTRIGPSAFDDGVSGATSGSVTTINGIIAARVGRDAGRAAEEVILHLTALPGATPEIILEIQIRVPGGIPESVMRTIIENCRTLKFDSFDFESE